MMTSLSRSTWLPEGWSPDRVFRFEFIFGSALRLVALVAARHIPFESDARDYADAARLILNGVHFIPYWPPGLPLYLLPFVAAGASDIVLRASMLFFWTLACWGILRLARAAGIGNFAWMILLVFALMPSSIQMSIECLTMQPVAALLLLALSATIRLCKGEGMKEVILLGLSLGWMALVRPSALPLVVLLPATCLLVARRWKGPILSLVLGTILIGGWVIRAHELSGAWIINNSNAINFYDGNNPWTPMYRTWYFGSKAKLGTDEIHQYPEFERILIYTNSLPGLEGSAELKRLSIQDITHRPGLFLLRTFNRMRCYFGFDTFTSANLRNDGPFARRLFPISLALEAFLYLSVAGPAFFWLALAPAGFWRQWQTQLIAASIVVYAIPYWLSMSHPTYHYPIVMPMAILGAMAWKASEGRTGPWTRGWVAVAALAAIQVEWVWEMAGALRK
jgi:hypothetical protein